MKRLATHGFPPTLALATGMALMVSIAPGATGCAGRRSTPEPREAQPREPELSTAYHDQRAGREISEQVRAEIGLVDDPELLSYLNLLGQRLARQAPGHRFEYSFAIVDQEAPNAFALPGGFIFVSRGLITLSNSEAELANVLGHEIAHVASRHAAARQGLGSGLPGLLQGLAWGQLAAYGRDQEKVADRLGQGIAALAGYDPDGLTRILRQMEAADRLQLGASRIPRFLDTHPTTRGRAAEAAERASRITWSASPGISGDREDYLQRLAGLAVRESGAQGIFDGSRFLHPELGFTIRFPENWETRNTARAVGALAPRGEAQVLLEHGGPGTDPSLAAAAYLKQNASLGLRAERTEAVKLAGRLAHRVEGNASTPAGSLAVLIHFVTLRGSIYRITGLSSSLGRKRFEGSFLNVARSFRPLTRELLDSVQESRLRLVRARGGESLQALGARTGNQWNVQETAVVNDLFANESLEADQLVKISVAEPYVPAAAAVPNPAAVPGPRAVPGPERGAEP